MAQFTNLEDAQAEIIRLNEELEQVTGERDILSQNNTDLTTELDRVRKLNQHYYNKLEQQYIPTQPEKEECDSEPVSCEDFAKTLNI